MTATSEAPPSNIQRSLREFWHPNSFLFLAVNGGKPSAQVTNCSCCWPRGQPKRICLWMISEILIFYAFIAGVVLTNDWLNEVPLTFVSDAVKVVQCSCSGWPTGYGKKLSRGQAQLGQATCLAVAQFLSISCGPSWARALYRVWKKVDYKVCVIMPSPILRGS